MRRNDRGIALLAVVWVIALLATIAASLTFEMRTEARLAYNVVDEALARAAADAGIYRAVLDLVEARPGQKLGEARFRPDGTIYEWTFADSRVYISVQDESGKVNLNTAPEALLVALFAVHADPEDAAVLADAIADFRDFDDFRRPQGAERSDYDSAGLAWGPKNAPFEAIEELRQVLGVTRELYRQVEPFVTLYSFGSAINQDVASEQLIEAIREAGFDSFVKSPGPAYAIRAEARRESGAKFVRGAVVQLILESDDLIRFLVWRQGR